MLEEKDILLLLIKNPAKGLERLIDDYSNLVYTIVYSKLSSLCPREDIEETVSDIFYELYDKREEIDPEKGSVKSYLALIAKRRAIDLYRKKLKEGGQVSLDQFDSNLFADKSNTEKEILEKEKSKRLLEAINKLDELDRQIIISKYYLGQKSKALAKSLNLKENTVNKRASRALTKLKEELGGDF